ncbi:MAG TPA: glycosyl hydrolase family 65 protein [Thermomicrobiales bacterium]|nr:glycosyl hydrolase family 65 protein [Thermomicrobiales bacterium]
MIERDVFEVDPWTLVEPRLRLDHLGQTESIFALSNGHIGLRGNLDEGEPHVTPGTYLNGFFEHVPLPYAETGYGYPELGQSIIDVTNGKLLRLLVDDEPFDVRYGTLRSHRRVLDLRAGVLRRELEWVSPAGKAVRVRSTRLVSFSQRAIAAIDYEVEPVDEPARIVVQSSLIANEPVPEQAHDPRTAAALRAPLVGEFHWHHDLNVSLGHRTKLSNLGMAAALDHVIEGPADTITESESETDLARVTISTDLAPGEPLRVTKLMAYGWSSVRSMTALRDQVDAALSGARRTGWDGLVAEQRKWLDRVWDHSDIEIDGNPRLQQAVRFAVFQVVQAAARVEERAIPAKGLTGRGYDGHTFWDMESYVLAALTYSSPRAARQALLWRHATLDLARARARELRLAGAAFPWRTIRGEESSGYWPAGTAGFHINADIADAVHRYISASGDTEFEQGPGLELLVETARLWRSLGHHDPEGRFRIDGVTGPDEYTALVDNNTYTNLMAARNLRIAAGVAERHPEQAAELGVDDAEIASWWRAADNIRIPYDSELGVTMQSEGFTRYRKWDFTNTGEDEYPLLLHYPYYLLYSSQVVKQADLVFALYTCSEHFPPDQKRRDFNYYEAITVRDSSLSAAVQAIVAAEVGHLALAYDYLRETAYVDLWDLAENTADGLHLAALAGAAMVVAAGFGGMRNYGESLTFSPRLPRQLERIAFRMLYRGRRLRVEITADEARYTLAEGEALDLHHHGKPFRLATGATESLPMPWEPNVPAVVPPPGREACRQGIGANGIDGREAYRESHEPSIEDRLLVR